MNLLKCCGILDDALGLGKLELVSDRALTLGLALGWVLAKLLV